MTNRGQFTVAANRAQSREIETRYDHLQGRDGIAQLQDMFLRTSLADSLITDANVTRSQLRALLNDPTWCQQNADRLRANLNDPILSASSVGGKMNEAAILDRLAEVLPATAPTPVRARPVADIGTPAHTA